MHSNSQAGKIARTDARRVVGYSLLIISCIAFAVMPAIFFLPLEAEQKTAWLAGLFILGEVTWWVGIPLLGKEILDLGARYWDLVKARFSKGESGEESVEYSSQDHL